MLPSAAPPRGHRGASSLALVALLLIGLINVAYVAWTTSVGSTLPRPPPTQLPSDQDGALEETVAFDDPEDRHRPSVRVGMALPARGPPMYRPGRCAFLAAHHLEDRFVRDDACFSRTEVLAILRALVVHAAHVFEAHNITYFLESGTLLGAYRHQDVIPHDYDGDLAIDAAGFATLRATRLPFDYEHYAMDVWDSPHYENAGRDAKLSARLIHKQSALYVDVFVFHDRVDARTKRALVGPVASDCYANCVHCPRTKDGRKQLLVPREWVYPLRSCSFGGHELKCPAKTVEYLTHEYGEDFMDPI